jgi:pSer/pThr/pTyr-binding forkhead associated (FHA) protein
MIDIVLLVGKFLLLALVYLFLFAAVRAGIGVVSRGGVRSQGSVALKVTEGPKPLKGMTVPVSGPVVIGRAPGSDIVISDSYISSQHARVTPSNKGVLVEDLGSTNGTVVNGSLIYRATELSKGDEIELGAVRMKVVES